MKAHSQNQFIIKWHFTMWLYHSRSRFSKKLTGKRRSFLEWKNWCFFIDTQKTKVDQNCYFEDFLTAWMSSSFSGQWLWIPARQCSVTPRKSDTTVSIRHTIHHILQILILKLLHLRYAAGFDLQDIKDAIKNKWKITIETVRSSVAQLNKKLSYRREAARCRVLSFG